MYDDLELLRGTLTGLRLSVNSSWQSRIDEALSPLARTEARMTRVRDFVALIQRKRRNAAQADICRID
jgi:hypothetical protein